MNSVHGSPKFWTGLLLAGGASKRMGQCKTQLTITTTASQTFLQKSWSLLEALTATQYLLGKHDEIASAHQLNDRSVYAGPLKALVDAFAKVQTDWILLIPVDMPGLSEQLLCEFQQFAAQNPMGCFAQDSDGRLGFPVAIPRGSFKSIQEASLRGETSLFRVLESLGFKNWKTTPELDFHLQNINTPNQLDTWRAAKESAWKLAK